MFRKRSPSSLYPTLGCLIFLTLALTFASVKPSHADFTNGENAVNLLGQFDTADAPAYSKRGSGDSPNNRGFFGMWGVAVDTVSHHLFVADYQNRRVLIFNLDSSNALLDHEADGVLGQADMLTKTNNGTSASSFEPLGLTYDPVHNRLFVADTAKHRILIFNGPFSDGEDAAIVIGQSDFTSSSSTGALRSPYEMTYDGVNDRLFASSISTSAAKVLIYQGPFSTGMVASVELGGALGTTQSRMQWVAGIFYASSLSKLFVSDYGNNRVLIFNEPFTNGMNAANVLGQADFTSGTAGTLQNRFDHPSGLFYQTSSSRLFVADSTNNRMLVFSGPFTDGENAALVIGQNNFTSNIATTTQSSLWNPIGINGDPGATRIFVSDGNNNRVAVFNSVSSDGQNMDDVVGTVDINDTPVYTKGYRNNHPSSRGFQAPPGVFYDTVDHQLFVADSNRVMIYNLNTSNALVHRYADLVLGAPSLDEFPTANVGPNVVGSAEKLTYDAANNRLFVADSFNHRVLIFNAPFSNGQNAAIVLGQPDFTSGSSALTQNGMDSPRGVDYDAASNRLFVADSNNNRVLVFQGPFSDGQNATVVLGQSNFTSNTAVVSQSGMSSPYDVKFDSTTNRLFVSDSNAPRILIFSGTLTNGMNASVVLGQANFTSSDFATSQSGLSSPIGIDYAPNANRLFVADRDNQRVMVFDGPFSNGQNASKVLGQTTFTDANNAVSQSAMDNPCDVSCSPDGNDLFVVDQNNHRVMMFSTVSSGGGGGGGGGTGGSNGTITSVQDYVISPNPYRSSQGHTDITFSNLSANTQLKVFTLTGELVRELTTDSNGSASWNAKNASGEKVASGVYYVYAKGPSDDITFKVVIQR